MRSARRSSGCRSLAVLGATLSLAACADLAAVRDVGRSAAGVAVYSQAATPYVDSARTSAAFVAGSPEPFVGRAQRQQQADDALVLQAAVAAYFAALARLAGDDAFTLAALQAMATDGRRVTAGKFDRLTIEAYADLGRTLARFAETPGRERAVRALVVEGGPAAMRLVATLRSVAVDWRAQVANDARQVDDTLAVGVLPADVPPLLRILATDRRAELARDYAATLRKMRSADTALASVERAHAELVSHLDDLSSAAARQPLRRAAAELQASAAGLALPISTASSPES